MGLEGLNNLVVIYNNFYVSELPFGPIEVLVLDLKLMHIFFENSQQLLSNIRMPLMSREFLMYTVESEEIIQMDESCKDLLIEAMKYHLMPEKRNQLQSIRTKERRSQACRPMLFAVGKQGLLQYLQAVVCIVITARQRICGKVMFSLACVCSQGGGVHGWLQVPYREVCMPGPICGYTRGWVYQRG